MDNKFEQLSSNAQSEHQLKQFKSKKQIKIKGLEPSERLSRPK